MSLMVKGNYGHMCEISTLEKKGQKEVQSLISFLILQLATAINSMKTKENPAQMIP